MKLAIIIVLGLTAVGVGIRNPLLALVFAIPALWMGYAWLKQPRNTYMDDLVAAADPSAEVTTLTRLSMSERSEVRMQVALNPRTSEEVLHRLATDVDRDVAVPARERLGT